MVINMKLKETDISKIFSSDIGDAIHIDKLIRLK